MYTNTQIRENRFGSTPTGDIEMLESGLREVDNPSELFINQHDEPLSGISIALQSMAETFSLRTITALLIALCLDRKVSAIDCSGN